MRFYFAGASGAKARAKDLARLLSDRLGSKASLASCQAAMAVATGYASFAELLEVASQGRPPSPLDDDSDERTVAERRESLAAALVARLGIDRRVAEDAAGEAGVTARRGPVRPDYHETLTWPVRYAKELRGASPGGLEAFDFTLDGLLSGATVVGAVDAFPHLLAGTAVSGADAHVMVRWATREEVLENFLLFGEEEADDLVRRYCHPSQRAAS